MGAGLIHGDDHQPRAEHTGEPARARKGASALLTSSPRSRVIAGCVMVVLAAVTLLYSSASGMKSIADQEKSSTVAKWSAFDAQQQCLKDAITHAVPRGATLLIDRNQSTFFRLELAELSIPWATPVDDASKAMYEMRIVPGSHCGNESLSTEKLG